MAHTISLSRTDVRILPAVMLLPHTTRAEIFRAPFTFYTDPSLRLHTALGMTLRVLEPKSQRKRGGYVRHGHVSGIAMVFKNALRVGMPVWEKGGDPTQLGGEFILGPG
jgi:hypothetical protein